MDTSGDYDFQESESEAFIVYSDNCDDAPASLFDLYDQRQESCDRDDNESQILDDIDFSLLKDSALKFIGEFYADPSVSRAVVQRIVECTSTVITQSISIALKVVDKLRKESAISDNGHSCLCETLTIISNPFKGLETEFKRFSCLMERGVFLKPESFVCGRRGDSVTGQFLSLKQTWRRFFELPNVMSSVESYLSALKTEKENGVISNFIQGELWESKCRDFGDKFVLPLFIHFDEVDVGNAIGPHSNIHKLGAMNSMCPCLPPEFVSLIENYFLVLLFHAADRYADNPLLESSNNKIMFNKVIDEVNDLRSNGISITTENKKCQLYLDVGLILGDNLGLHGILGLAECFTANFPCLYCKMLKHDCRCSSKENLNLLRNIDNYVLDVATNDVSQTGIKEECVFNNIESFHVTTNYAVDFMHDVLEGVCCYDLVEILYNFVYVENYFSIELLNEMILSHSYGNVSNKPPLIAGKELQSGNIKMSANETLVFVQHLPAVVGSYVPVDDEYWKLFLFLYEIVLILMSRKLDLKSIPYLDYLITQHHILYCGGSP
ncbi:hypothetical protein ONE63_011607 [Megalurothrips usitatus]|uniref:Uncharacterized protein n=1 Tax=Megalurothrips usitatus TaxID=439358 RepID=A0AAV7X2Y5_9NEOP|nr:hypothetical protein ONE63_011607 [Megalurothrips usitatus]